LELTSFAFRAVKNEFEEASDLSTKGFVLPSILVVDRAGLGWASEI
jgi:hypothetical protein